MEMQLEKGTWTRLEPIEDGEGAYGMVYEVQAEDGSPAAAKIVLLNAGAERESLIGDYLKVEDVPNVIPVIDWGIHAGDWVMVMPKADKSLRRHLNDRGGRLETDEAILILTDLATALVAIKSKVVHRDLKPENILLHDGKWCVADFGVSRLADAATSTETRKYEYPKPYAAPEQWRQFLAEVVTPRFPQGLTVWPASGQWRTQDGSITREASYALNLLHADDDANEAAVRAIVDQKIT